MDSAGVQSDDRGYVKAGKILENALRGSK
jgi:hypothetical protein